MHLSVEQPSIYEWCLSIYYNFCILIRENMWKLLRNCWPTFNLCPNNNFIKKHGMVDRIIKNIKSTLIIIYISTAIKYNEKYKKKHLTLPICYRLPQDGIHVKYCPPCSKVYLITLYTNKQTFSISDFPTFYISVDLNHDTSLPLPERKTNIRSNVYIHRNKPYYIQQRFFNHSID